MNNTSELIMRTESNLFYTESKKWPSHVIVLKNNYPVSL